MTRGVAWAGALCGVLAVFAAGCAPHQSSVFLVNQAATPDEQQRLGDYWVGQAVEAVLAVWGATDELPPGPVEVQVERSFAVDPLHRWRYPGTPVSAAEAAAAGPGTVRHCSAAVTLDAEHRVQAVRLEGNACSPSCLRSVSGGGGASEPPDPSPSYRLGTAQGAGCYTLRAPERLGLEAFQAEVAPADAARAAHWGADDPVVLCWDVFGANYLVDRAVGEVVLVARWAAGGASCR